MHPLASDLEKLRRIRGGNCERQKAVSPSSRGVNVRLFELLVSRNSRGHEKTLMQSIVRRLSRPTLLICNVGQKKQQYEY